MTLTERGMSLGLKTPPIKNIIVTLPERDVIPIEDEDCHNQVEIAKRARHNISVGFHRFNNTFSCED